MDVQSENIKGAAPVSFGYFGQTYSNGTLFCTYW